MVGNSFPIDLRGAAPEQALVDHYVSKPGNALGATLTLATFDADMADEGELVINGNTPISLFGDKAHTSNDDQNVTIELTSPAEYWRDGKNSLVFHHNRTVGYSISNRPSWADLDTNTVRLSGVPGQGDGGTEDNIRISVNDGSATASLPAFNIVVAGDTAVAAGDTVASPGSITLRRSAPSTREDGTPLSVGKIAGYTLFYGTSPGNYTDSIYLAGGDTSSKTFSGLPSGKTFYIVLTTSDANGLQSAYSNSAQVTVQ